LLLLTSQQYAYAKAYILVLAVTNLLEWILDWRNEKYPNVMISLAMEESIDLSVSFGVWLGVCGAGHCFIWLLLKWDVLADAGSCFVAVDWRIHDPFC